MGRIAVLPQSLINQIAAGEVVARPASVLKELVDNSIDAGARRITIVLARGGRDTTVIDDGRGMDRDDAELCLQRHATSKVRTNEDLTRIMTRGFRGEAIPSICSVARVEIQTRPHDSDEGTRLVIEGGRIEFIGAVGCPPGTRFQVKDLFYNTPARLKFLKTDRAELGAALQTAMLLAMSQPEIGFRIESEGRVAFDVPAGQTAAERVAMLWRGAVGDVLDEARGERHEVKVHAVLGKPEVARPDRRYQAFFVNRRPIVSRTLAASLAEAYRGILMVNLYPVAAVFIEIDPTLVDVNVHPTKEEVRFRDERAVAGAVYHAVLARLKEIAVVPVLDLGGGSVGDSGAAGAGGAQHSALSGTPPGESTLPQMPGFFLSAEALAMPGALRKAPPAMPSQIDWSLHGGGAGEPPRASGALGGGSAEANTDAEPPPEYRAPLIRSAEGGRDVSFCEGPPLEGLIEYETDPERFWKPELELITVGQISNVYIAAQYGEGLLLVDQHAAHEKLLYLKLSARRASPDLQTLLMPITFDVSPRDMPYFRDLVPVLRESGVEAEEFGGSTVQVVSVPAELPNLDARALIEDMITAAAEDRRRRTALEEIRHRIHARMACRAAIKAGQRLSPAEMSRLLQDVRRTRLSYTCPHGRPTMLYLSKRELDRQFRRIV